MVLRVCGRVSTGMGTSASRTWTGTRCMAVAWVAEEPILGLSGPWPPVALLPTMPLDVAPEAVPCWGWPQLTPGPVLAYFLRLKAGGVLGPFLGLLLMGLPPWTVGALGFPGVHGVGIGAILGSLALPLLPGLLL